MGELTERGKIVAAGGAQLAATDGDDTLRPVEDQSDARGDSPDVETERQDQGDGESEASAADSDPTPGPADIPPPPKVETADDTDAAARENR